MSAKFLYGVEGNYKKVTPLVNKFFLKDGKYVFKDAYYNSYFSDCIFGREKHLKIEYEGDIFYIKENSDFILDTRKVDDKKKINIVYFINVHIAPILYKNLLITQLTSLRQSGLLNQDDTCLYIEVCTQSPSEFNDIIKSLNLPGKVVITFHLENNHEYYGIHKVWELRNCENSYILYFHSKGITRLEVNGRDSVEAYLLNPHVIIDWRRNIRILNLFDSVQKLGICTNRFVWYNFFWVKPEYLNLLEEPIQTNNRYYYEDWLSRIPRSPSENQEEKEYNITNYIFPEYDCFNLNYCIANSVYNISPPVEYEFVTSCQTH